MRLVGPPSRRRRHVTGASLFTFARDAGRTWLGSQEERPGRRSSPYWSEAIGVDHKQGQIQVRILGPLDVRRQDGLLHEHGGDSFPRTQELHLRLLRGDMA